MPEILPHVIQRNPRSLRNLILIVISRTRFDSCLEQNNWAPVARLRVVPGDKLAS